MSPFQRQFKPAPERSPRSGALRCSCNPAPATTPAARTSTPAQSTLPTAPPARRWAAARWSSHTALHFQATVGSPAHSRSTGRSRPATARARWSLAMKPGLPTMIRDRTPEATSSIWKTPLPRQGLADGITSPLAACRSAPVLPAISPIVVSGTTPLNFNQNSNYSFRIVSGTIDPSVANHLNRITIDSTAFAAANHLTNGYYFQLNAGSDHLDLQYVPEPGTGSLIVVTAMLALRRRRRRASR